jgi:Transposase DDE domain
MPSPMPTDDTTEERSTQVQALVSEWWESEVEPRLPTELEVQAKKLGALQRKRGLSSAAQLLRALLAYALCAPSFRRVGAWAVLIGLADLSEAAWRKALRRASDWLAWLLGELLAVPPHSEWLGQRVGGRVLAIDGTALRQVGGSGDDWRLHTAYDLRAGRLSQVSVTDEHSAESLAHSRLQAGDVVVADNGYGYRRSVALVVQQQADGVFRITPATFPLQDADGEAVDVQVWLRQAGEVVRSLACWCVYQGQRYAVRLIALQLPAEAAEAARERKRRKASKDGRTLSEATLFCAGWILLITTLPAAQWSASEVLRLYRARWQVELFFKRLKQLLRLALLRCIRSDSVQASIRLVLVAWALQQDLAAQLRASLLSAAQVLGEAAGLPTPPLAEPERPQALEAPDQAPGERQEPGLVDEEVVSSWLLCDLCLETLRQQVRGQWSQARVLACVPRLRRFLLSHPRPRGHQETAVRRWFAAPARGAPLDLQEVA